MSDLGWGAGGVEEAMQLMQSLQTGKIQQQQEQVKLEGSQLQLENLKKLQTSLSSGQFAGMSSSDPQEQNKALTDLANTYLADGMPEQAAAVNKMANDNATTRARVQAEGATTALNYLGEAEKVFSGVETPEQWKAAQQYVQSILPPEALQNKTIHSLLTTDFDKNKVAIIPGFIEHLRGNAQAKLDQANALHLDAESRTQEVDARVKEEQINLDKTREEYLRKTGGFDDDAEGSPTGEPSADWKSKLRNLVRSGAVPLPIGSRGLTAQNQFYDDAYKNNKGRSPDEVFADIKSNYIGMKGDLTEAGQVARRDANVTTAQTALVEPNGIYTQLDAAAKKIDFGDSKTLNAIQKGLQKHVYANPDIQAYVTTLEDARAELATVFSRSGQTTDLTRRQAQEALPDASSYEEIQATVAASKKLGDAVVRGNQTVLTALKSGKPIQEVLKTMEPAGGKVFANEAAVEAARKAGKVKDGDKVVVNGKQMIWKDN